MNNRVIVRPEHLNHHGYLFGGMLLKWVDEFSWIAASLEFPGCTLVTIAMDRVLFRRRVVNGSILRIAVRHARTGTTSVAYQVTVFADAPGATEEREIFSTAVTLVRVDADSRKCPLPERRPIAVTGPE